MAQLLVNEHRNAHVTMRLDCALKTCYFPRSFNKLIQLGGPT